MAMQFILLRAVEAGAILLGAVEDGAILLVGVEAGVILLGGVEDGVVSLTVTFIIWVLVLHHVVNFDTKSLT